VLAACFTLKRPTAQHSSGNLQVSNSQEILQASTGILEHGQRIRDLHRDDDGISARSPDHGLATQHHESGMCLSWYLGTATHPSQAASGFACPLL
jgi:hypothetical protein